MAISRPELRRGRIIWVVLSDARGNLKRRPAVVLTPTDEIALGKAISVMAISTSFPDPAPENAIELPWHSDSRRVSTKLSCRSAAVINWLCFVEIHEIQQFAGDVPPKRMLEILRRLSEVL